MEIVTVKDSNDKLQVVIEKYLSDNLVKIIRNKKKRQQVLEKCVIAVMAARGMIDINYLTTIQDYNITLRVDDYGPEVG